MKKSSLSNIDVSKVKALKTIKILTILLFFTFSKINYSQQIGIIASQGYYNSESIKIESHFVQDLFRIGDKQNVSPSILWKNNVTFMIGDKGNTYNNQIQAFQYNHNFGSFNYLTVGNGTDDFDIFNHPTPYIWLDNNYVYTGQTNTHNAPIEIYKSNIENDIRSGFSKLDSISGENAYPKIVNNINNNAMFVVRQYPEGVGNFNLSVQISNSDIEGSFTKLVITENTIGYRHYPGSIMYYGQRTKDYLITNFRNDNAAEYFMHAVYWTDDYITFHNQTDTFSKNIVSSGELTMSEIETNFVFNGSTATDTTNLSVSNSIQINDILYTVVKKEGTTDYYVFKTTDSEVTNTILNIPNIDTSQFFAPFIYYNGTKLLFSVLVNDTGNLSKEIWSTDLSIENLTLEYKYSNPNIYSKPIMLPDNLNDITGEYAFLLDYDSGNVVLGITNNKFDKQIN